MRKALFLSLLIFASVATVSADDKSESLKAVIDQHLAAIGTPEARAAAKSLGTDGGAYFHFLTGGGGGESRGTMKMASDGPKLRLVVDFGSMNYSGEDFVSDGSKVRIAGLVAGKKSLLGGFVDQRPELLKEGLFGGVLSTAWPLLDVAAHKAKLKYNGTKKIDGEQLLEVAYEPKKMSGNEQIRLYFDPETHRHVMTTYSILVPVTAARTINPDANSAVNGRESQEGHQVLTEKFSNFKVLDGVTLPSKWTIEITEDLKETTSMKWEFVIVHAVHAPVDPSAFQVK